jgi:hypothetical protein
MSVLVKSVKDEVIELKIPNRIKKEATELLREFDMDYKIVKRPSTVKYKGVRYSGTDFGLLNLKTRKVINQVKEGYTISQNQDLMELVLYGIQGYKLSVERCSDINGGRKMFIQIRIEGDGMIPRPDGTFDRITRFITILDSNDGSCSVSIGIGDSTASCDNQFFHFYKKGQAKFRHSKNLTENLKKIPNLLELAMSESVRMISLYKEFQEVKVNRVAAQDAMVMELLGYNKQSDDITPRAMNNMSSLYNELSSEMNDKGDSLWGLHSGVTKWTNFTKAHPKRDNGMIEGIMTGENYKVNAKSLAFVTNQLEDSK